MQIVCSSLSYGLSKYHQICSMMDDVAESRLFQVINILARKMNFFLTLWALKSKFHNRSAELHWGTDPNA